MANILILSPTPITSLVASRGSGAANLLTADPKEIWIDGTAGSAAALDIDLGVTCAVNTVFLASVLSAAVGASWTITGGIAGYTDLVIKASGGLRVPATAAEMAAPTLALDFLTGGYQADVPTPSHAFWTGTAVAVRYLRISITQPAGLTPVSAGAVMAGAAFQPVYNKEWGSGRRVIDTGAVTALPSGGYATVEGARKGSYRWTLADLTDDEVEVLYAIQLARGEGLPVLVVEDPDQTAGLYRRIHYGRFAALREYERRDAALTKWEMAVEDWV